MTKLKIKSGDTVKVVAGDHKGSEGKVLTVLIEKNKAIVEGVNMVKKHTKPNPQMGITGGIVEQEAAIDLSNVSIWNQKKKGADKIKYSTDKNGKKIRLYKSNDVEIS